MDWAIRDCSADGKGYGVVALRDFRFGEVIMYSRRLHAAPQLRAACKRARTRQLPRAQQR